MSASGPRPVAAIRTASGERGAADTIKLHGDMARARGTGTRPADYPARHYDDITEGAAGGVGGGAAVVGGDGLEPPTSTV